MKDSYVIRFFRVFGALRNLALTQIRQRLDRLTPRQRLRLVGVLFVLFLIVDIIYIVRGFTVGGNPTFEIEHIKQIPIGSTLRDSINLINPLDYER